MPATKYSAKRKQDTTTPSGRLKSPEITKCTRCGTLFNKADKRKNFTTVKSPLWAGNDNKLPICNECLKFYYNFYERALGDVYSAYRRICMKFDIYYNEEIVNSIMKNDQSPDRIGAYISQLNYARYQDKTYDNTIEEENGKILYGDCVYETEDEDGNPINIKVEYEKLKAQLSSVPEKKEPDTDDPEFIKVFGAGSGFTLSEQKIMLEFYNTQCNEIPTQLMTTLGESIKDMARFKILQGRAIAANELKEITTYSTQFSSTRKYIDSVIDKFKKNATIEENAIILGPMIQTIENFCPAEVYEVKDDFKDVDRIGSLISRFFTRPTKNFFTGSREADSEFKIE